MAKQGKRALMRSRIRKLLEADPGRTDYRIGAELGCSPHTVKAVREEDHLPKVPHPASRHLVRGPVGNGTAIRHGAFSERRIAPLRERHQTALRGRFDAVDERLLSVMAHRMAQYELVTDWLDAHGVVKGRGDIYPAAQFADRLARNFEQQFDRLAEIQRDAERPAPINAEAELAAIAAESEEGT